MCDPTTGELLAEVTLDAATRQIASRARAGHESLVTAAAASVRRFADAVLDPEPGAGEAPSAAR